MEPLAIRPNRRGLSREGNSGRRDRRRYNADFMYEAITHQVKVTVEPTFDPARSDPDQRRYFWRYTIEIANLGDRPVTLIERHWRITDAEGRLQEVRGPGVIGEQPTIAPNDTFRYTSGCPLTTPSGMMVGEYAMVDPEGRRFKVSIPAFSLDSPDGKRVLN
jgi:ApaG protein